MKRVIKSLSIFLCFIAPTMALASVTYTFDFTDLNNDNQIINAPAPDFSVTLTYPGFVTTTGLFAIAGDSLPTTLGYSVIGAGTNSLGWWGFADNTDNLLTDDSYGFVGGSFLFTPSASSYTTSYFTAPGTFTGSVTGSYPITLPDYNGWSSFQGNATLTISETGVPEPSSAWLLAAGLVAILVYRRRLGIKDPARFN